MRAVIWALAFAFLLIYTHTAHAADTYGIAFQIPPRDANMMPYHHCTLEGVDAADSAIYQEYPVPEEGGVTIDMSATFKERPHPLIFDVTCYGADGTAGLAAEPSGRNKGPGQPEFLGKVP